MASVELGVPLGPEHVFRLGSITKQFTAVAVLMLAEEGKLSLDDEVTRHFPGWPTHGHRITVEHLLTHTSGIRSYTSMPAFGALRRSDLSLDSLLSVFRNEPMDFAPGADWRYNNSAYVMLGALVERASGMRYADFLKARIFEPLGMDDTRFDVTEAVVPRRVTGYAARGDRSLLNAAYLSMSLPHAAGSLVSTVDDLLLWQRAVADGRLIGTESWRRAFTPFRLADGRSAGYGHGWFLGTLGGAGSVEHGGDINGFSSNAAWVPTRDLYVVVLTNVERDYANPSTLTLRIAERMLGVADAAPAVALSPGALDAYVGVYAASETDRRVVLREGTTLYSQRGSADRQELQPLGGDVFVYPSTGTRATFVRGADGEVTEMRLAPRIGPEQAPSPRISADPEAPEASGPPPVQLPAGVLDRYVGRYEVSPTLAIDVRRDGDALFATPTGQPERALVARSPVRFTVEGVDGVALEFQVDDTGPATAVVLEQGGRRVPAPRTP